MFGLMTGLAAAMRLALSGVQKLTTNAKKRRRSDMLPAMLSGCVAKNQNKIEKYVR